MLFFVSLFLQSTKIYYFSSSKDICGKPVINLCKSLNETKINVMKILMLEI